ncbi:TNF receptor-associated factor 3-like isoform X2 [Scyliorhinus canicula]|uniref:TNF receptor-associated factor 3-like isoform X2 n=1 Tax=Scyliorhinus canicula TaxID=7830 RepID=UPI0018F29718|nr:TNF receptor-associated factor 3-like isoform X2 [Scyliorhinus canicula]
MATEYGPDRSKSCLYQSPKESPSGSNCRPLVPGVEPLEGGYAEEFVQPVDDKYRCEHCSRVLCNARQTECGHRFCESCLDTLLRIGGQACPADQEPLDGTEVFNDNCCRKEVLRLMIHCRNHKAGCKQQMVLSGLEAHLKTCPFQQVQCTRSGCSEFVRQRDLGDHLTNKCKHREVKCKYCQKETTLAQLQTHETSECPYSLRASPKNCGAHVHRPEIKGQMSESPKAEGCCKFSSYGCTFKGLIQRTKEHESHSVEQHLLLVLLKNKALEEKVAELESEVTEKRKDLQQLANQIPKMEKEMLSTGQSVTRSEIKLNQSQKTLTVHTDKLQQVERELLERGKLEEDLKQDILAVRCSMGNLSSRVSVLENGPSPCLYRGASSTASAEHQVIQHDRMLSVHEVRLAEIDLRFQLLETASYNGKLVWKIRDYTRRKQEAVSGKTLSLYSQPFYTSSFGYKMCARVYLNGDGMGKSTHLSLFFVVMHGEYDPLLPWPFRQKVTLALLDQGPSKKHVTDLFKPDPDSTSFRKPHTDMNIASGCPLFVPQPVLENEMHHYIKDDTIFIKVTVDVSDSLEL